MASRSPSRSASGGPSLWLWLGITLIVIVLDQYAKALIIGDFRLGEARTVSLEHSEADIALRMIRPEQGSLTLLKLGDVHFRLYASPAYLATVQEADWRFVGSDGELSQSPQQRALQAYAADRPFAFHANSVELQLAAACAGAGIAALPDFMARGHSDLAPIARDQPLASRDLWLVVHTDLKRAAPVRAVMEEIRKAWHGVERQTKTLLAS